MDYKKYYGLEEKGKTSTVISYPEEQVKTEFILKDVKDTPNYDEFRAQELAKQDAKVKFGFIEMSSKAYRSKLSPKKKKEVQDFLIERRTFWIQRFKEEEKIRSNRLNGQKEA